METTKKPAKPGLTLDYRFIVAALLLVIAGMLALWRPWEPRSDRTIEVTGQATVKATPDEFVFYPSYEFTNVDRTAALAAMTAKSDEVIKKLKELGVAEAHIKTNANSYTAYKAPDDNSPTYVLQVTVTITNKDHAQKIQDYLVSTAPIGGVTPQAAFSDDTRRELENKARDEATKDARSKAEQSATNLGFSIGPVKTVNDGVGFGGFPMRGVAMDSTEPARSQQLAVQPGENELNYSVTVTYFVR